MAEAETETGVELFNRVIGIAMGVPGITVDRAAFLRREFSVYCRPEQLDLIVRDNPVRHLSMDLIDRVAKDVIQAERYKVTAISAATGLPSNPAAAAGLAVADMGQYSAICLRACQELAYLYGMPDLLDEHGEVSSATINLLTPLLGIMFGVQEAVKVTAKLCEKIAEQVVRRLPAVAFGHAGWYVLVKQIAKIIGVRMSKQLFSKGLSKVIPLIGAAISGAMTYAAFGSSAESLRKHLEENSRFFRGEGYMEKA